MRRSFPKFSHWLVSTTLACRVHQKLIEIDTISLVFGSNVLTMGQDGEVKGASEGGSCTALEGECWQGRYVFI